jgi:hypothetical protein
MRLQTVALAALAILLAGGQASAADDLAGLLKGLGAAKRPDGDVTVTSWVETGARGADLVVHVEPRGAAKLVAEPGVTVTPLPRDGLTWPGGAAATDAPEGSYITHPVELRLPFRASDARPVEARVDYAYCLTGYQCLFGETTVSAVPPASAACAAHPEAGKATC